ncbi:glucokinase [uncultured Tateyamaria sp.]|uniref:glucokinase n=1 Tax=uncultured Tateyamaria sp. TaxID=455651 RepID=UPI0026343F20|nr:glucokinase [uncultured Tateyamaria sp.]
MQDEAAKLHLVADVGGTNCRLALADTNGVQVETWRRFRNDDHGSFAELARIYLADQPLVSSAAVAIAGPVGKGWGRLTNRDWHFDADELAGALSLDAVHLLNDLEALGHAIAVLPEASLRFLSGTAAEDEPQSVVIGLGTGFNVSVAHGPSGVVFAAEMGHAALPQPVASIIRHEVSDMSGFDTVEHLLSGSGLARLHQARTGHVCKPEEVADATGGAETQAIMARALGALVREVAYLYLPEGGIYFNGSLARTLLTPETTDLVLAPLQNDDSFHGRMARMPMYLLTDDASALHGCARYLSVHI